MSVMGAAKTSLKPGEPIQLLRMLGVRCLIQQRSDNPNYMDVWALDPERDEIDKGFKLGFLDFKLEATNGPMLWSAFIDTQGGAPREIKDFCSLLACLNELVVYWRKYHAHMGSLLVVGG